MRGGHLGPQAASAGAESGGAQAFVYQGTGSTGNAGTTAAGACGNVAGSGGLVEAGTDPGYGTYVVVDGSDNNPAQGAGYVGLSNYDDSASNPRSCSPDQGDAASTNGGECFNVKSIPATVDFNALGLGALPTPMCGDTSGADWNRTPQDGCFFVGD